MKESEMDRIKKLARFTQKIKTEFIKGIKPNQLIQKLKQNQVNVVVDIRWWSVYPIYFAPKNMVNLLAENNLEYLRYHELGNPAKLRHEAGENFELAKSLYLNYIVKDYTARQKFKDLFKKLRLRKTYCLICYCQILDPRFCHRFWLKEALVNAKRIILGFEGNYELEPIHIVSEVY